MGVLYFAPGITQPSVLWMRRMLDGLDDEVQVLALEEPLDRAHGHYGERYQVLQLDNGLRSFWRRGLRRLLNRPRIPVPARSLHRLEEALAAPEVSVALVHYANLAVRYARVWQRVSKPVYVHCHGYDVTWDLRLPDGSREHPVGYEAEVKALPENVRFLVNSKTTGQRLRGIGIKEDRIVLKYLGVPMDEQLPRERPVEGPFEILYLGRLIDCKGPDLVIQAFEAAVEQGLDGRLWLAGDGPLRGVCESLRDRSAHRERIEILGAVGAARGEELRRRAHVFTAHNRKGPVTQQEEAFGVSVVEAMAEGLPVISGRNGSLPEVVEDGVQGILVPPGDVEAHAQAFLRLAENDALRRSMGEHGWHRARENFTLEQEMVNLRRILGVREDLSSGEVA